MFPHASRTHRRVLVHGTSRVTLALSLLLACVLLTPASAFGSRLSSDRVGTIPLSAGAVARSSAPDVSARAGKLVTADGRNLWSRKSLTHRRMASTTKVMTALVVLESCTLSETVRVTRAASRTPYAMGLRTGERRTVRQMLQYLLMASSNDAATALAVHVSGSVPAFSRKMNTRARQLGLADTHYVNPHGLDQTGQYTSAKDLSKLILAARLHPEFRRIVRLRSFTLPAYRGRPERRIRNTDSLLGQVPGFHGGKTGRTGDARYCFVGTAQRDGVALTSVVLGAPSSADRFWATLTLLEWGFKHYRIRELASETQTAGAVPLADNPAKSVVARISETTSAPVFDLEGRITHQPSLVTSVAVPVYAGQPLGLVRVMQGSSVLTTVPVVATTDRASAEETVGVVPVAGYHDKTVVVRTAESTAPVAVYDPLRPVRRVVKLDSEAPSPVAAGQRLGRVSYYQDFVLIVTVPVVAAESVEAPGVIETAAAAIASRWAAITE